MKKVMVAYFSRTGKTEAMANYIAEGLRITGQDVDLKKISAVENEKAIAGYDGYVFGCPTYHKDMTSGMNGLRLCPMPCSPEMTPPRCCASFMIRATTRSAWCSMA